jgi:hypothetical protein
MSQAKDRTNKVQELSSELTTKKAKVNNKKEKVELELADIMPTIENAKNQVSNINPSQLTEIRN